MPSGEVFTGPVETSAAGVVRFGVPSSPRGVRVSGITLEFRDGLVVSGHADTGDDVLQAMLATDPGARRLGEIGIGTNYGIDRAVGMTLLDEKIGGTVHLALGRSYPETGGTNESAIHWDMICTRPGSRHRRRRGDPGDGNFWRVRGRDFGLCRLSPRYARQSRHRPEIASLAGGQHGVVARWQLLRLGLSEGAIDRRLAAGRLHRLHRGVFAVGHTALRAEGRWMAAVLALGGDAVLSHATAAAAWDLRPLISGAIHVTVPGTAGRKRRAGIRLHRSRTLTPHETTTHRGIPVTTPRRTIIDLARTLEGRPLEHVARPRRQRRLIDFAELRNRPIPPSLQAVLSLYTAGSTVTRSEMEERFLALCDHHGIPRPKVNTRIEGEEVDFVWRDATTHRRGRRLRLPPLAVQLRSRPRARRDARAGRLARHALHLDPAHRPGPHGWRAR